MKKLIIAIFMVSSVLAQAPWQDPGLKIEHALTHNSTSYIFYRDYTSTTNNNDIIFENKLYRKNINSGADTLLFTSSTEYLGTNLVSRNDAGFISFSAEHPDSFYLAGQIEGDSTGAFIKGKWLNIFYPNKKIEYFFASKQTPGKFYVKIDGNYMVSNDYCKTFQILHQVEKIFSVSPFNDMEIIALNLGKLVRSNDGGINYSLVDDSWGNYDSVSAFYTQDSSFMLITLCTVYSWMNEIRYSNQSGNPGTYSPALYWFFGAMELIPYKAPSDSLYFYKADTLYSKPLASLTLTGQSVSHIFDKRITGSATVKGSTDLFISTRDKIYKKAGNSYQEVKFINIPVVEPDFYPMHTGDFWVYKVTGWWADTFYYPIDYTTVTRVKRDTTVLGWGKYFVSDRFHSWANFGSLERESENGKIFELQYWGVDTTHYEILTEDNSLRKGDISDMVVLGWGGMYSRVTDISYKKYFGKMRATRELGVNSMYWYFIRSVDGIGIEEAKNSFDFGEENFKLVGAYIDGVVYGDTTTTGLEDDNNISFPKEHQLFQNYPNPFNPTTVISYALPVTGFVSLIVYDNLGRVIKTLVNEEQSVGKHEISFNASEFSSGIYFYTLRTGNFTETKKLVLLK